MSYHNNDFNDKHDNYYYTNYYGSIDNGSFIL